MKAFRALFISFIYFSILICFTSTFNVKGQQISTVAEIYDFEVGDNFHYYFFGGDGSSGMSSVRNIEILDKYYSANNITLFYIRDINYKEIWSGYPVWTYDNYIDTISYGSLDSLINFGNIDSVYSDTSLYNGRIINYMEQIDSYNTWKMKFVIGCGKAWEYSYDEYYNSMSNYELVYYKKEDEEWGVPNIVTSIKAIEKQPSISLYPNPADDLLNIKRNSSTITYNFQLRNLYGQLVKEVESISFSQHAMNVADLKAGVYFYVIRDGDKVLQQGKLVIK